MINKIKTHYYQYQPDEFLPVYMNGALANKKEFHKYRFKKLVNLI